MSREHRTRIEAVSWHPAQNETAITIHLPGEVKVVRGEIITVTTSEGKK